MKYSIIAQDIEQYKSSPNYTFVIFKYTENKYIEHLKMKSFLEQNRDTARLLYAGEIKKYK